MAKQKYINCDIYRRGITLFIGGYDEMVAWSKHEFTDPKYKEFLHSMEAAPEGAADCHYDCGSCVVRIPKVPVTPEEVADLAHEILHATFYILCYSGVEFAWGGNNEAYTYLFTWLLQKALEDTDYEEVSDCTEQSNTSTGKFNEATSS